MEKPYVVLIAGPTGVGKTATSVLLSKKLDTDIISCDSMQVYKGMDIGTAKVTKEEMQGTVHHMISVAEPSEDYSVSDYVAAASEIIWKLHMEGKTSLLVGGTGLYADSLIKGIEFSGDAPKDEGYREQMMSLAEEKGAEYVHLLLKECDPESADKIHPNNIKRVIRALEYYRASGERISDFNKSTKQKESPYRSVRIYLTRDRENLYRRIDERVDKMLSMGLEAEVRSLMEAGIDLDCTSMQALGYKEMAQYIKGECSYSDAVESIKKGSRRYAKRQLTWFRRDSEAHWINLDEMASDEQTIERCMEIIEKNR